MQLDQIIAIGGRPGLYEIALQTRTGVVATSLVAKRINASVRNQVSLLSEINIYGQRGAASGNIKRIFEKEEGKTCAVKPKAPADELEAFFFEVFQDYDEDRVYPSDIKKIIQWYNILVEKAPEVFTEEVEEDATQADE